LGVNSGVFEVTTSDGSVYDIEIEDGDTIQDLISALNSIGVNASIDENGVFRIDNAHISNQGDTGIIDAFGITNSSSGIYGNGLIGGDFTTTLSVSATE
jgi:hypothetical protein